MPEFKEHIMNKQRGKVSAPLTNTRHPTPSITSSPPPCLISFISKRPTRPQLQTAACNHKQSSVCLRTTEEWSTTSCLQTNEGWQQASDDDPPECCSRQSPSCPVGCRTSLRSRGHPSTTPGTRTGAPLWRSGQQWESSFQHG
jgi:hypothetical protein